MITTIETSLPTMTSQLSAQYVRDARPEVAAQRRPSVGGTWALSAQNME